MKKIIVAFLLASLTVSAWPTHTMAAKLMSNGLTLNPAIEQINLNKGQTSASFSDSITNNTKTPEVVLVTTSDFTALNNAGGVEFLDNSTLPNISHGLARWLQPNITQFALPVGGSQTVNVIIANVASLAPGGHYGAVVFKVASTGTIAKTNQVSSNEDISMLVFLTTYGNSAYSVRLDNAPVNSFTLHMPTSIDLVFTNNGNAQTAPVGIVTVTDSSGKELARGTINVTSGLVLPSTSGLFIVKLNYYGHNTNLPGSYNINVIYQASASAKAVTYVKGFFFINEWLLIFAVILLLALSVFLIRKVSPNPVIKNHRANKIP